MEAKARQVFGNYSAIESLSESYEHVAINFSFGEKIAKVKHETILKP